LAPTGTSELFILKIGMFYSNTHQAFMIYSRTNAIISASEEDHRPKTGAASKKRSPWRKKG